MKRIFFARYNRSFFATAFTAGQIAISALLTQAADAKSEDLRQKVAQLQRSAEELKAAGQEEEAGKLMREVEELRNQAQRFNPGLVEADRKHRLPELNRELRGLKGELKELHDRSRTDEAAEVKVGISRTEPELDRIRDGRGVDRDDRPGLRPRSERPRRIERNRTNTRPRLEGQRAPAEAPEMSNRLRHLNAAIDNLHAAGLHEMAERLTQEAEKMREQLHHAPSQPPGPRGPRPPEGEFAPLRQEIQELRRAVEAMRRQLEELRPRQP